jgi:peptidyl-prolyl cis-trans isomerase SurA
MIFHGRSFAAAAACAAFFAAPPAYGQVSRTVDKTLAIVNDTAISLSAYRERLEKEANLIERQYQGDVREVKMKEMQEGLLDAMLRETMLIERAKEIGIDIAHVVDQTKEDFKKQNKVPNDEKLKEILADEGMTMEDFLQQITQTVIPQLVIRREVAKRVEVGPEEAEEFYRANTHLFPGKLRVLASLYFFPGDMPSARTKAEAVSEGLKKGLKHSELVEMLGLDRKNGFAEVYEKGDLLKDLEERIFTMKETEISEPVLTERGYYVMHVISIQESDIKPFEEVKDEVFQRIRMQKFEGKMDEYLEELKVNYFVEVFETDPNSLL